MKHYYRRLFRLRAFRRDPLKVAWRAALLVMLLLTGRSHVIVTTFGSVGVRFRFRPNRRHYGGRGFFLSRRKIEDLYEYGDRFLRAGSICLDGGANQGIYTVAFARYVGPTGHVVAIEPFGCVADLIVENAGLNELGNVDVERAALSDHNGTAVIDLSDGLGTASIVGDWGQIDTRTVPVVTIDRVVQKYRLPAVDFIKLDIEGAEELALAGAAQTISRYRPTLCLELGPAQFGAVRTLLQPHGYEAYVFDGKGSLCAVDELARPTDNVFFLAAD